MSFALIPIHSNAIPLNYSTWSGLVTALSLSAVIPSGQVPDHRQLPKESHKYSHWVSWLWLAAMVVAATIPTLAIFRGSFQHLLPFWRLYYQPVENEACQCGWVPLPARHIDYRFGNWPGLFGWLADLTYRPGQDRPVSPHTWLAGCVCVFLCSFNLGNVLATLA